MIDKRYYGIWFQWAGPQQQIQALLQRLERGKRLQLEVSAAHLNSIWTETTKNLE